MMVVLILFMFVLVLLKLTFNSYFWTVIVEFFLQCNQYIVKVGLHSSLPMSCVFCLPGTIHTNWWFAKRIQQRWHLWMAIQESRCPCDWVSLAIRLVCILVRSLICIFIGFGNTSKQHDEVAGTSVVQFASPQQDDDAHMPYTYDWLECWSMKSRAKSSSTKLMIDLKK
jgi:hypothetical protein